MCQGTAWTVDYDKARRPFFVRPWWREAASGGGHILIGASGRSTDRRFRFTVVGCPVATEHTGPLSRAAPQKQRQHQQKFPPHVHALPIVGQHGTMTEVEPRSADLFVAGRAQRSIVNKFGIIALPTSSVLSAALPIPTCRSASGSGRCHA